MCEPNYDFDPTNPNCNSDLDFNPTHGKTLISNGPQDNLVNKSGGVMFRSEELDNPVNMAIALIPKAQP